MGDDEGTRARGVGGRCRSILRAASDALTRCETRLNEVNEKYTFELCPEYRLKVNKTIGTTRVGMTFDARERRYRVAVKRAGSMKGEDESEREDDVPLFWRAMNKLVLDPEEKRIELYSRRVDYGPLSLRGVGEAMAFGDSVCVCVCFIGVVSVFIGATSSVGASRAGVVAISSGVVDASFSFALGA